MKLKILYCKASNADKLHVRLTKLNILNIMKILSSSMVGLKILCISLLLLTGCGPITSQHNRPTAANSDSRTDTMSALSLVDRKALKQAAKFSKQGYSLYCKGKYDQAELLLERALKIHEKVLGPEDPDTASSLNNLAMLYVNLGAYAKAQPLYERALKIKEKVLGPEDPSTATILSNLALLYDTLGDYSRAEPLFERALEIHEKVLGPEDSGTATSLNNLAGLYDTIGAYAKAEPLYERALKIREKVLGPEHPDTASSLNNLAGLYFTLGDCSKAEPLYERALKINEKVLGPEHPDTASSLNNLAGLYFTLGDYSKAEPLYERALKINEKVLCPEHPSTATSLNNLALLYKSLGDYSKAEPLFERALKIDEKVLGPEHPSTATSLNNLAGLYNTLGDYSKAEPLYERALKIREKVLCPEHPSTATSLNNLALLYKSLGDYSKAEPLFERALKIDEKVLGLEHSSTAISLNNLAGLALAQGKVEQAIFYFRKADSSDGLGVCYLATGEWEKAEETMSTFLKYYQNHSGFEESTIATLIGLGLAREGQVNMDGAVSSFQQAVDLIETRYQTLAPAARRTFLGGDTNLNFKRLDAYEGLIRTLIKLKDKDSAVRSLQVAERVKSRTLLEQLAARGARGVSREDGVTLKKDREFQQNISMLYKQLEVLDKLKQQGKQTPRGKRETVARDVQQAQADYEQFINEVKINNLELASLISVQTVDIAAIQQLLGPDITLLEYFVGNKGGYAWIITKDTVEVQAIDLDSKRIAALVNDYRENMEVAALGRSVERKSVMVLVAEKRGSGSIEAISQKVSDQKLAAVSQTLYRQLIRPVEKKITTSNLIIVPHGALHKLPFAALAESKKYLIEEYALSTAPSSSVLYYVSKKRNPNNNKLLAFANPKTQYPSLPGTETEVAHIRTLFSGGVEVYKRAGATETMARLKADIPDVLHFAGHGEFNERQPMQSGLLLSRDDKNDGRLQVHELFGLNLKNANLVTLSACQTALTRVESGDDMIGLSRGFIYAGTPALLASLWDVDDNSTSTLMQGFYDNWLHKKMSRPEALRQAQLQLINNPRTNSPYYWAAFELIGDWL